MPSYQRRVRILSGIAAILLTTCATSAPINATLDASSIPSEFAITSDRPAHAGAVPTAPSIKPVLLQRYVRRLATIGESSVFPTRLSLCPRMKISNAPHADEQRRIRDYRPFVVVEGQQIAVAPVEDGCLSSGFGFRNGRPHKGIDLYHASPVKIFAVANGTVREKHYRKDYGNMLVIQHGDGLFARYAHLERFASDIHIGATVKVGQTVGFMGNTASYRIPRHLHYEVLTGDYETAARSFHLTPVDLFAKLP